MAHGSLPSPTAQTTAAASKEGQPGQHWLGLGLGLGLVGLGLGLGFV